MSIRRVLMLGASSSPVCGVRDYAGVLAGALRGRGVEVITSWWERDPGWGPARSARELGRWSARVARIAGDLRPDRVLWHYSVFTYAHRGIPVLAPLLPRALRSAGVPVVALLHELAYSFDRRGWRGPVLALTQRVALAGVLRSCAGAIVTTEQRALWLRGRPWLPRRPVAFVPVCAGVPAGTGESPGRCGRRPSVGVFGFGAEGFVPAPVASAVASLRTGGLDARLVLVGAPGAESAAGRAWRLAAAAAGCTDALDFTGTLEPGGLAEAIAGLDVLILPDEGGPSSRKTTMAAALASAKPVVAFDGPHKWDPLVSERALVLTPPTGESLAAELEALLRDDRRRKLQAERAADFYRRRMAPEVVAESVLAVLESARGGVVKAAP